MRVVRYAVRADGEKRRWWDFRDGGLLDKFDPLRCLVEEDRARAFLRRPGLDTRYRLCKVTMTVTTE